jgi:hypothetical protein
MSEHHNKLTAMATYWCRRCSKHTLHRVDSGLRGACLTCLERLENQPPPKKPAESTKNLFDFDPYI